MAITLKNVIDGFFAVAPWKLDQLLQALENDYISIDCDVTADVKEFWGQETVYNLSTGLFRPSCDRCMNSGKYPSIVENGVCFKCNGAGKVAKKVSVDFTVVLKENTVKVTFKVTSGRILSYGTGEEHSVTLVNPMVQHGRDVEGNETLSIFEKGTCGVEIILTDRNKWAARQVWRYVKGNCRP